MEREYGNRANETDARALDADSRSEREAATDANAAPSIPHGDARKLLDGILTERAEVFRKLAR